MRPIKLTIEGFTSFPERTEIDFTDLDLFAIVGPTGSGKTSLLDAMTWALYGKTSRLGKTAAELISHGSNKVTAHLEFAVGSDRYQVARTAKRGGSPQVRLEKHDGAAWTPGEADGATEINEAVCKIVGLDFDAFTRSVVLPQGKFDAFLRGEHKERREILKTLLGLEVYDRMRELAGGKRDQIKAKEEAQQGVIDRDYAEATADNLKTLKSDLRQKRKSQKDNLAEAKRVEELSRIGGDLRRNRESLTQQHSTRGSLESQHDSAKRTATNESNRVESIQGTIKRTEDQIAAIVVDDTRYAQLVAINERAGRLAQIERFQAESLKALEQAQVALRNVREQCTATEQKRRDTEEHRTAMENARAQGRERLKNALTHGSADLLQSLIETLRDLPSKRQALTNLEVQKGQVAGEKESLLVQLKEAETGRAEVQEALDKLKAHLEHMSFQHAHRELRAGLKKGEPCPICEQAVSKLPKVPALGALEEVKSQVKTTEKELRKRQDAVLKIEGQIESLPRRLTDLETRIAEAGTSIEFIIKRIHGAVGKMSDPECLDALTRSVSEIRAAEKNLAACEEAFQKSERNVRTIADEASRLDKEVARQSEKVAGAEQELGRRKDEIEAIRPQIQSAGGAQQIAADLKALEESKKKRDTLTASLKTLTDNLNAAQTTKSDAERDAAVLADRLRTLDIEIARLNTLIRTLSQSWVKQLEGIEVPNGSDEADRAEKKRKSLEDDRVRINGEIVRLESTVEDMEKKIVRLAELKKEVDDLRVERNLYEQLATALRADRFVAYLLESAYADLCAKGSEHLMRLSQERYTFTAGKNEFNVRDGWNADAERSARTLSGGESFLASLALALALADSVASFGAEQGQGTKIDALFLDEGVSSLDQNDALPAVVEALSTLQMGDRMVCVISHMEDLAERLPARIEVVKNHGRSSVKATGTAYGESA